MNLLGIDIGTTGAKAAVFSDQGELLCLAYREYETLSPNPGWFELDSRHVVEQVWACISEATSQVAQKPGALSISSMGEAVTPVDAEGNILAGSILMKDMRGEQYVDLIRDRLGQEAFYQINPNILAAQYSLPKILWIRRHQPELFARTHKFLLWTDLISVLLGAQAKTSYSMANRTLLLDIRRQQWSRELLELADLDPALLPEPVASGEIIGQVRPEMARKLGLAPQAAIVTGGHDQGCNALGAGGVHSGSAVCGLGTVECTTPVYDTIPEASTMLQAGLNVEHHVVPDRYVSFLYNQAGSLVRWFRDTFAEAQARSSGADIYPQLMAEMPKGPSDVFVLPYFEPTGPPDFLSRTTGVIAGLRTSTRRGEILKAVLEGTTFYFLESFRKLRDMGIDTSRILATGGGAKSDPWLQIKADILNVPMVRLDITECGAAGAAILAGLATGVYDSPQEASKLFAKQVQSFEPDPKRHERYAQRYEQYRSLVDRNIYAGS
jgi:xylulokinase